MAQHATMFAGGREAGKIQLRKRGWSQFPRHSRTWIAVSLLLGPTRASAIETAGPPTRVVVLELFTSQGCSSCPRADELLSRLGADERTRAIVVPLAFHVDYWNRIGWTDPFSASAWSLRQAEYCRSLRVDSPYTPQLVVDGEVELNGTDVRRILGEIDAARERPPLARVRLSAHPGEERALVVDVEAEVVEGTRARRLDLLVALFENGLVTPVGRGENGGRTLRNDFVVRRLFTALSLAPEAGARGQRTLRLKRERDWKAGNLGVAAFLQDTGSRRIHAAAVLPRIAP